MATIRRFQTPVRVGNIPNMRTTTEVSHVKQYATPQGKANWRPENRGGQRYGRAAARGPLLVKTVRAEGALVGDAVEAVKPLRVKKAKTPAAKATKKSAKTPKKSKPSK